MTDYTSLSREQLIERLQALESRQAVYTEQAQSEAGNQEIEANLRQLMASVDLAFWICDVNERCYLYLSPAVETLFGSPLADLYGDLPCFLSVVHPQDQESVVSAWKRQLADGHVLDLEFRIQRGPDDLRWIHLRKFPIRDATGRIHRMAGVAQDVTQNMAAKLSLHDSEQRYRGLVANLPGIAYRCAFNVDWTVEVMSGEVERVTGYPASDFLQGERTCASIIHPEDRERVWRAVEHGVSRHEDYEVEYRMVHRDGSIRYVHEHGHGVYDDEGHVQHLDGFTWDVTDRRKAEQALIASEERYRAVVEHQTEVISRLLADGTLTYVNPVFCRFFGMREEELIGTTWRPVAHPDDVAMIEAKLSTLSPSNPMVVIENRVTSGQGQERWIQFVNRAFFDMAGRITEIQSVGRDITDRKQAEQACQEAETFKQAILDAVTAQVAVLDRTGTIIEVNEAWHRFAQENALEDGQLPLNTEAGCNYLAICRSASGFGSEGAREMAGGIQAVLDGRSAGFTHEYPCHAPHARRWFLGTVTPLDRAEGGVVISHHDISAPRLLAEELRQNAAITRSILRAAPVGIGLLVDRVFREVNQAMTDMTGYTREELIGRSSRMLYPTQEEFDDVGREKYGQIKEKDLGRVETRWRKKDGRIIVVTLSSAPVVPGELTQGVSFTAQDITAIKRAEQERLQHEASQRDALVREVHHRIKNNLQGVIGLMRQHISAYPETRAPIEGAIDQISTIAMVHGLQSRLGQNELRLCEMLHAVNATTSMAMASEPPTIDDQGSNDIFLNNSVAVSVALILNELIHNALKHSHHAGGVKIVLTGGGEHATIRISNPGGPLPPGFDLENGTGCGTGLDLVRTLLPARGTTLTITQGEGRITTSFVFAPPVTTERPTDATTGQEAK